MDNLNICFGYMQMYEDAFETKFLKATEALYHEEGNRYMQETDVSYDL